MSRPRRSLMIRVYKRALFLSHKLFNSIYVPLLRAADKWGGVRLLELVVWPIGVLRFLGGLKEYAQFKRLRETMPDPFWKGFGPLQHYFRMLIFWEGSLATGAVGERLNRADWKERIQFTGDLPWEHPAWGQRPFILTFLHLNGYIMVRYALRAQGIPAASLVGGLPLIYQSAQPSRDLADQSYGLAGIPHTFTGAGALRQVLKFMQPGRLLVVALDAGAATGRASYRIGEQSLELYDGAARLAMMSDAVLVPVTVIQSGICRFKIHFGPSVPDEILKDRDAHAATQFLGDQSWKECQNTPPALGWTTLEAIAPDKVRPRMEWP